VIWLIFLTSVLAVFTTLPGVRQWLELTASPWADTNIGAWATTYGNRALSASLIILSVTTTALLSFAGQFSPLKAWVMYRVGADRIRSEIYMYRLKAGVYENGDLSPDQRRKLFLERIEVINQQIYELETAPPFLQLMSSKDGTFKHSTPRRIYNWILKVLFLRWRTNTSGKGTVEAITPKQDERVKDGTAERLSGRYYPQADNGFNEIDIETYIEYRVMPQRNWYVQKVYEDYEKIKDWRKVTLTIGGASAVLAAVQLEPYIVITTAAVVAVNTHIQLNLIGSNHGNYHVTASRIDNELVRWRNLPDARRDQPDVVSQFVSNIEAVLEAERTIWMQQAFQAQQESEQNLIKGADTRSGVPSLAAESNVTAPTLG
ncbi:MAG: SLATT domain-containing protein, partial [Chloroflexota bacterium]